MSDLRVALDGRMAQQAALGGVGRLVQQLSRQLVAAGVDVHVLLDSGLPAPAVGGELHPLGVMGVRSWVVWLQVAVPLWLRSFDGVFHGTFNGLPFAQPAPMVVTIHDLSFVRNPEWLPPHKRFAFQAQARHAARTARCVVTVSRHEREGIVEHYGLDPDRVLVAPNAIDEAFRPAPGDTAGPPRIVALGGAQRRHPETAVAAWRLARRRYPELRLTLIDGLGMTPEPGLEVLGPLTTEALAPLLASAVALLYPTDYESFGMPGLEALACATPVIARRVGALPEVLGDAATWVDSAEPEAFAEALGRLLGDGALLAERRRAALAHAGAAPGWADAAAVYLDAYRQALAS